MHGPAERHFNVVKHDITFEKFESRYRCEMNSMNDVFLAENETGPWTELAECMYEMPIGALLQSFPNTKYIKLVCSPPESEPSEQQNEATGHATKNAFDILMAARQSAASQDFPARKTSR